MIDTTKNFLIHIWKEEKKDIHLALLLKPPKYSIIPARIVAKTL